MGIRRLTRKEVSAINLVLLVASVIAVMFIAAITGHPGIAMAFWLAFTFYLLYKGRP